MISLATKVSKLSHKAYRALQKKLRRKKKRQLLAQARDEQEKFEEQKRENDPNYKAWEAEKHRNLELWEEYLERERLRKHKQWLLREERAQLEFQRNKLLKEQEKEKKDAERKKIIAEIEAKLLLKTEAEKVEEKKKNEKEEILQEVLSGLPEKDGPWHNPVAPMNYNLVQEQPRCLFFNKTGCCRFGERCSRGHAYPEISPTILIKGMYSHFSMDQSSLDDYDTDMGLEYEDRDTYQDFKKFYEDVLPEFRSCGRVVQFKVCYNHEPHLRGNVYVQYAKEKYAVEAFKKFNGRYYAGKQLTLEFTNVVKWKAAICGLNESKRCPKGNNCNFLHAFQNPHNEFWAADRDLPEHHNELRRTNFINSNGHRPRRRDDYSSHRSERDDYSHRSERNDYSHRSERDDYSHRSERDDYSHRSERDDYSHRSERDDHSHRSERDDYSHRSERDDYSHRSERDDHSHRSERDDYSYHHRHPSRSSLQNTSSSRRHHYSSESESSDENENSSQRHHKRRKRSSSRSWSDSPESSPDTGKRKKKKSHKKKKRKQRSPISDE